ncbi:hypothetical protein T484DRAFT_1903174, partial [Baffinella frigidus]
MPAPGHGFSAGRMDSDTIAHLYGAQVVAALQFEMEEVFGMTTEGLRGRLLMLRHAQSQGHAPPNAEKLIMFLNLELQERAAGREIEQKVLEEHQQLVAAKQPAAAPTPPPPKPTPAPPRPPVAASVVMSGSSSSASSASTRKPEPGGGGSSARSQGGASSGSGGSGSGVTAVPTVSSASSVLSSSSASVGKGEEAVPERRDRPWNAKPRAPPTQAFSLGTGGVVEVCFATSSGNSNRYKKGKKDKDRKEVDVRKEKMDKEKKEREAKEAARVAREDPAAKEEERRKALKRIADHKAKT